MINLSLVSDWGIVDLFALVGFRERTFPGEDGWPRGPLVISSDDADYESGAEDKRVDIAARWSTSIEAWELALSYFGGTSRDPEFRRINAQGEPVPFYPVIDQFGLELQYNYDAWLLKMEALNRSGTESGRYFATVFGFEYTLEGLFDGVSPVFAASAAASVTYTFSRPLVVSTVMTPLTATLPSTSVIVAASAPLLTVSLANRLPEAVVP